MNMHEKITAHRKNRKDEDRDQSVHVLRFSGAKDQNPKTYNAPSSAEVSCVVVGEGPLPKHFISVYERPTMTSTSSSSCSSSCGTDCDDVDESCDDESGGDDCSVNDDESGDDDESDELHECGGVDTESHECGGVDTGD